LELFLEFMLATGPFARLKIDWTILIYIRMEQDKFLVSVTGQVHIFSYTAIYSFYIQLSEQINSVPTEIETRILNVCQCSVGKAYHMLTVLVDFMVKLSTKC
jgi:uncharacterized membrane protein